MRTYRQIILLYSQLARFDKPIGIYLLLWPCFWGLAYQAHGLPSLYNLFLFALGAAAMRGAGCTFNDWVDRRVDAQVERTKNRPLASGRLSAGHAFLLFAILCLAGLWVMHQLPWRCWGLSAIAFALLVIYPFMKRITHWPQVVLGLAFNSGVWIGAAVESALVLSDLFPLLLLYMGGIFWTVGYDTVYALQDRPDDLKVGVKSTAVRFGSHALPLVGLFYALSYACFLSFGLITEASWFFFVGITALGGLVVSWLSSLNPTNTPACLDVFKKNTWIGVGIFLALIVR